MLFLPLRDGVPLRGVPLIDLANGSSMNSVARLKQRQILGTPPWELGSWLFEPFGVWWSDHYTMLYRYTVIPVELLEQTWTAVSNRLHGCSLFAAWVCLLSSGSQPLVTQDRHTCRG